MTLLDEIVCEIENLILKSLMCSLNFNGISINKSPHNLSNVIVQFWNLDRLWIHMVSCIIFNVQYVIEGLHMG